MTQENNKCSFCGETVNDINRFKKAIQGNAQLDGERDPLGIAQATEIWPYRPIVDVEARNCPRK